MFSESKIRKIVLLLLLFWYSVELAQAGEQIVLSPSDTHSNQRQINEAIKSVAASGGGTVYLNPGVYYVDNTIVIRSNVNLIGDPEAIIRVSPRSSQWFKGPVKTVLLKDVKDENGQLVTDHLWFNMTKGFEEANLQPGDIVEFRGKVEKYIKGYRGRREDVYKPLVTDYKLSRPTKVRKLEKETQEESTTPR
jgi:hypothetical protein